ncbi:MAG: ATP phosphoribosyltransferase regulatory subunit [Eubacteriales bacterium]|nr:ATP phosphoribosyltransferase regulatory subunit [Eubacteriales bacterium]
MGKYKKHVPDGVEDCLPAECYIKKEMENALRQMFILSGYEEIETPTYEFYDVFQSGVGSYMQESMIKFVDSKGRILVLRPDITVPIARAAATKLLDNTRTKRLFYIQNSYATAEPAIGKAGEFTQAGIELLGDSRYQADAEVIALAIRSLLSAGLSDFTIDIGQVAFFKALLSGLDLQDVQIDELRHAVDSKDMMAINTIAKRFMIDGELKEKIATLPNLFGGPEVFEKAVGLSGKKECVDAVENLRNVYTLLSSYGMAGYISVDFGMLHDIAYYSGIIFRGITPGLGFPVVSGGRYDELLGKFGDPAPATGFALGIKRVMIAMERQGLLKGYYDTDTVVSCDMASSKTAHAYAEDQRKDGKRTVYSAGLSKSELMELKAETGAANAVYFDADGNMGRL